MTNMTSKLLLRLFPFVAWFPISPLVLRADLVAGITGALVLVPKAMAYAQLAGLPCSLASTPPWYRPSLARCGVLPGNWPPGRWPSSR